MECNWNGIATDKGLLSSNANEIFSNNFDYSCAPTSKYHGVNANLRTYGDIFQRCYSIKTKRIGNRSSQDMLKIAKLEERNWNQDIKWYSRHTKVVCFLCGKVISNKSDIQSEHILPFATAVKVGVINNPKNYAPAHSKCNILKDNKLSINSESAKGDFNDLANGYTSILLYVEKTLDDPLVIDREQRIHFIMSRIISALCDYRDLDSEEKELLQKRMEILDRLAQWYMEQKKIKAAIVDGNVKTINELVKSSEKSKYYALKWKNAVIDNNLEKLIKEKDDKIQELEAKLQKKNKGFMQCFVGCFKSSSKLL